MGFFSRLKTGWALAMDSLRVLRRDPELMAFPLMSGLAGIVYVGLIWGLFGIGAGGDGGVIFYAILFVLYFGSTFIASFFAAGLVHETKIAFEGDDPSFMNGLRAAWTHVGTLVAWALVSATVGVIIRLVQRQGRNNFFAQLIAGMFSVAWALLTYFVVPVIVFEDLGVKDALTRSGNVFRQTWGETAGAGFGVGLVTILFLVGGGVAAFILVLLSLQIGAVAGVVGAIAVGAVLIILAYLAGTTLGAVAKTALFIYATEGIKPSEFEDVDFETLG